MEAWARDAVEKILMMLKVSMCEAEDGPPAAEQRAGLCDNTNQMSTKPKAGRVAGPNKRESVHHLGGCGEAFYGHTLAFFWLLTRFYDRAVKLQNQHPEAVVRRKRQSRWDLIQQ